MSKVPATSEQQATAPEPETRQPQLLFFFSPTSGASRRVEGFLAQVLQRKRNHSTFRLVRVDADRHRDLSERLRVSDVPTLLVVSDGRVRARLAKPTGIKPIRLLLAPWLR
jgi:thioredoxin-like negative regulator of GroEL